MGADRDELVSLRWMSLQLKSDAEAESDNAQFVASRERQRLANGPEGRRFSAPGPTGDGVSQLEPVVSLGAALQPKHLHVLSLHMRHAFLKQQAMRVRQGLSKSERKKEEERSARYLQQLEQVLRRGLPCGPELECHVHAPALTAVSVGVGEWQRFPFFRQ